MTYSSQVSSLRLIVEFKQEMARKFEISDLGKLTYDLGIDVRQTDEGIVLSQDKYAHKIFEEAGMHKCNLTHIPMDMNMRLSKSPRETSIDEREYMQEPKDTHRADLKQIFWYLCGTTSFGLRFTRATKQEQVGFSDSFHNVDNADEIVALSSCEAEFMVATEAAKQAIWLQELLSEVVGDDCKMVAIQVDNKSVI
ncbi:uncharacterized mitochondrial protein AtMg00810-like [Brassica napus]|uniref:uncharacterized mitochondrial protein AtMg00810-like n=1 Tax=Brassica napus TaxID=3708 RepID=UPI000BBF3246|nr:uncharacterized mitochondrial protein AtMg00810-like [Brassica napus]